MVEKMDLIGLDYVWEICINTPETDIAESAISLLLNMTYMFLSSRLKKVPYLASDLLALLYLPTVVFLSDVR
jgi:hypothetical protein